MADTKETLAIKAANKALSLAQALEDIRIQINQLIQDNTNQGYTTTWSAFATCAQNADGSLGTADATPNTAHPIDNRVAAQSGLQNAVSETVLANLMLCFTQLQNFFGNSAVATNQYGVFLDNATQ